MRICVFGAGAVGGFLGARLALAGADVTLIGRGPHLVAMRDRGLRLREPDGERVVGVACTDDPAEAGVQDCVMVTLKAHAGPAAAAAMRPLLGPETAVVTAMNGIPWWYFHGLSGPWRDHRLASVDPGNRQWDLIGPERAIGCVVYCAVEVPEPGVVEHRSLQRFSLGEPNGARSARLLRLSEALAAAGLEAPIRDNIRDEIWYKLLGNLSFNPISALTLATTGAIGEHPGTRALARRMMMEARAVGERLGVHFEVDLDQRLDQTTSLGAHKSSMLQDLLRGRSMEIDPLLTVVQEMGRMTGVETPDIDTVLALLALRAEQAAPGGA